MRTKRAAVRGRKSGVAKGKGIGDHYYLQSRGRITNRLTSSIVKPKMRVGIFNHFCKSATMHLKTFSEEQLMGDLEVKVQSMGINNEIGKSKMSRVSIQEKGLRANTPVLSVGQTLVPSVHLVDHIDDENPIDAMSVSSLELSCSASAIYASFGMQDDQISLYSSAPTDISCPTSVL